MSDEPLADALRTSVGEVLENMFFIDSLDEVAPAGPECSMRAWLPFEGSPSGILTLEVDGAAARRIAADFLAAEESEVTDRQVGDVICELANMICGSLLSKVESTTSFRLLAPRILPPGAAGAPEDPGGGESSTVSLSSGMLNVTIRMESPACPKAPEFVY